MALINAEVVHESDDVIGKGVEGESGWIKGHGVAVSGHIRGDEVSVFEMGEAGGCLDFASAEAV